MDESGVTTCWRRRAISDDVVGTSSQGRYRRPSRFKTANLYTDVSGSGTAIQQSYAYDNYANLIAAGPINIPASATTNRLTGVASYDAAGNLTCWNSNLYDVDAFGMMWRYRPAGQGVEHIHLHTADDERLWTFSPGSPSRWTLRDLDGRVLRELSNNAGTWSVQKDYVYRGATLVAAVQPDGQTHHLHPDHLGTPRLITNPAGAIVSYHVYYPYGAELSPINQDGERLKFTGHERDLGVLTSAADDLDYMHARYCSPLTGRFLSIDPAAQRRAHTQPQSWNRYAYARGNPLNLIDPDGRVVVPPKDRRTKKAVEKLRSTPAGNAAYQALEQARGVYRFNVTRSRVTPLEQRRIRAGGTVKKSGGHFKPTYVIADGRVQWQSGGTLKIDYGVVDRAVDQPYSGKHGDAALLAHEVGHASDYEADHAGFLRLSYDKQEESADELRDEVVKELEEQRRQP